MSCTNEMEKNCNASSICLQCVVYVHHQVYGNIFSITPSAQISYVKIKFMMESMHMNGLAIVILRYLISDIAVAVFFHPVRPQNLLVIKYKTCT